MAAFEGIRTWADGFGTWHAEVSPELTENAEVAAVIARGAIMAELATRERNLAAEAVGVYRCHPERGREASGLHFREYDPRTDGEPDPMPDDLLPIGGEDGPTAWQGV